VSIKKVINKGVPGYEICSSFMLEEQNVIKYFSLAEQVDEYEFNNKAIILPCKYQGLIKIDGDLLQWEIIAGGGGYLYKKKLINKRYLCTENCCNSLANLC